MGTLQSVSCATMMDVANAPPFAVCETTQTGPPKPRLLDRVHLALRARHGSRRHRDVSTTMIYTRVLNRGPGAVRSPANRMFGV